MHPLTLSLSPFGGEGIETAPSPSPRERVGRARARGVNVLVDTSVLIDVLRDRLDRAARLEKLVWRGGESR